MRFAWVLNQDAELELARPGYNPAAKLLAQLAQHGVAARALLGPDDVLIAPGAMPGEGFIGRAWCPTPLALAKLRRAGVTPEPHPSAEILRMVNHRKFAFDLGGGLPGQRYVTHRDQVDAALKASLVWLCKRPMAFAGRGQQRIAHALDDKQSKWIEASLQGDGLIIEPFITPLLEVSVHGFIWRDERFALGRVCVQDVSNKGVYRGVRLAADELHAGESEALFIQANHVAKSLAAAGYFGPFGIDAYRYEIKGVVNFCALSEINARYTMGFATGFPQHPSQINL